MDQPLNLQDAILNLQRYLRAISFLDSRVTRPPVDGLFDTETQKAVSDYQRTRGLPDTGIVDKTTWDAIFNEYLRVTEAQERSYTPNFFPSNPESYEAALGEEHAFIIMIQLILRELSTIYDSFPEVDISGVFDAPTEEAVKIFQRASGFEDNGRVDLTTWNRMTRDFFNYAAF